MVQPNRLILELAIQTSQQCHVVLVPDMLVVWTPQNQTQSVNYVIRTNVNAHRPEGVWDKKLRGTLIDVDNMQCLIRWSRFCTSNISFLGFSICGFIIDCFYMHSALRIKPTDFLFFLSFFFFFAIIIELQERLQFDVMHVCKIKELIDSWVTPLLYLFKGSPIQFYV
jgi:hypothetical protein